MVENIILIITKMTSFNKTVKKVMKKKMINMYLLSKIIGRTQSIFILMKVKSDD